MEDRTLTMRASRVQALLASELQKPANRTAATLDELVGLLPEGELIQITHGQGHRLFPINPKAALPLFAFIRSGLLQPIHPQCKSAREYFRLLCRPIRYNSGDAYLLVPSSLIEDQILSRTLTSRLLQIAPLLLIISSVSGYILSRRSLRPVDIMISEAKAITAKDLSRRLPIPAADDELRRLALEWNGLEVSLSRVEQFTADASHELRSPIAFIRATAQDSLLHQELSPESREAFEAVVEETTETAALLEDLLLLARTEACYSAPTEKVSLHHLLSEICDRFTSVAEANGRLLRFPHFGEEAAHFRRLMSILIDNALKYSAPDGVITVAYDLSDQLQLRVIDNGCGIAKEHQERVFDRFFQVDSARTGSSGGAGLGLSIAKWLVERHNGRIFLESELGQGTAVTITLRLCILAV